jgi:IS5 family transposase
MYAQIEPEPIEADYPHAAARMDSMPCKIPREHLIVLRVTADIAAHVCAHVLQLLRAEGVAAHSIAFTHGSRRLSLEVFVDDLAEDGDRAEALLRTLRSTANVQTAQLIGYQVGE